MIGSCLPLADYGMKSTAGTVVFDGIIFSFPMSPRFSAKIWHTQTLLITFMERLRAGLSRMIIVVTGASLMTGLSLRLGVSWLRRYTRPIQANGS
jgi:hypothetical protein